MLDYGSVTIPEQKAVCSNPFPFDYLCSWVSCAKLAPQLCRAPSDRRCQAMFFLNVNVHLLKLKDFFIYKKSTNNKTSGVKLLEFSWNFFDFQKFPTASNAGLGCSGSPLSSPPKIFVSGHLASVVVVIIIMLKCLEFAIKNRIKQGR